MEKIIHDKRVLKILCVVLATILWFFVSYQENPSMTKTVKNVPISIVGEQALKENGLSVYSVSQQSVNVKVTSKRLSLARMTNKTLSASINVSSIKESGKHIIPATDSIVSSPSSANSGVSSSASYYVKGADITVIVEPLMKGSFPVELSFAPSPNTSLVLRTGTVSPDNVTVKAPKSIINEIASIKTAEVVPDGKSTEQSVNLVAYAKNGKILEGIEFEPAQVKVSYSLYDTKTLPIVLKTASGDLQLLPSKYTVEVYGHGSEFDYLKQIVL